LQNEATYKENRRAAPVFILRAYADGGISRLYAIYPADGYKNPNR
jgi:hypothetical protein